MRYKTRNLIIFTENHGKNDEWTNLRNYFILKAEQISENKYLNETN